MSKLKAKNDRAALKLLLELLIAKKTLAEINAEISARMDIVEARLCRQEITEGQFTKLWDRAHDHRRSEQSTLERRIPLLEELLDAWADGENLLLYRLGMDDSAVRPYLPFFRTDGVCRENASPYDFRSPGRLCECGDHRP